MDALIETICDNFLITAVALCFLVSILVKAITTVFVNASRERSRREIAAYIAEGSIKPEQGERLLRTTIDSKAGPPGI